METKRKITKKERKGFTKMRNEKTSIPQVEEETHATDLSCLEATTN